MARVIFISPYLRGGRDAAKLLHRTRYIATRDGVELLRSDSDDRAPSDKQREFITRALRQFPEAKELFEYEDYRAAPSRKTASALIEQIWEQHVMALEERENFLDYVSHRPGVKSDGDHGLWNANGKVENLSAVMREIANHPGIVWTPVVTIRRADAERLGFTDVENWRAVVNACVNEIAEGYKIAPNHLRWYAALHEKDVNYHIHMVVFSSDPKEGYLSKEGIRTVKSAFARHLFEQDLISVYKRQTEYRNMLQEEAKARMSELIARMGGGAIQNERLEELTMELSKRLQTTKGKKVYGYLPPQVKRIVDAIVDELSRDERVAEAYSLWQEMRDEVCRTYSSTLPERKPLSQQKEFKPVRNMVIRETLQLSERLTAFDDERMDDESEEVGEWYADPPHVPPSTARSVYEQTERYRRAKRALHDKMTDADEKRDAVAALGKLLLEQGKADEGIGWLKQAAEQGNQYAQYALGKLYLMGQDVPRDMDLAVRYLTRSAEQDNAYAQYFLDHRNDWQSASVGSAVLRMLHHMSRIFQDNAVADSTYRGLRIDKKRRQAMRDKRIAMGHKPDDHEDALNDAQQRLAQ